MSAERAWALGMELKQAANTEHRKKFHLMRRLQRSVKHANELLQLCESSERCDARTRLEAQVRNAESARLCVEATKNCCLCSVVCVCVCAGLLLMDGGECQV